MTTETDMTGALQGPMTAVGDYVFRCMTAVAERFGLPETFKRDLYVHDRNAVMNLGNEAVFAWGLGQASTVLVFSHTKNTVLDMDDAIGGGLWFLYQQNYMGSASVKRADAILAETRNIDSYSFRWERERAEAEGGEAVL